jgi:hypothetical protein
VRALYDLSRYLTSFNYFEWQVQAQARGAKTVVFDARRIRSDKWPLDIAIKRFHSICEPGPALSGLNHEIVERDSQRNGAVDIAMPGGGPIVAFWKAGGRFKRLQSVKPPASEKYTVTLRKTQRSPLRDSDEKVWREFAAEIGALVIPDYEDAPLHLHDRMALYAGAKMNFFVSNGPGVLCSFTEYPCMLFNTKHARESLLGDGLNDGVQYPWMLPNQRAIWEVATPESLRRHFDHWQQKNGTFGEDRYEPSAP